MSHYFGSKLVSYSGCRNRVPAWYVQWVAFYQLIQGESRWNPLAVNRHSHACGFGQAKPCAKTGLGPTWRTKPLEQIRWAVKYVIHRYRTPCRAERHRMRHGWY
jgi:Transglycosylase SLT domain